MNRLENIGLGIFIIGFVIFLASFFMSSFYLTNEAIIKSLPENKIELFKGYAQSLIDKEISNNFRFVNELESVFNKINQEQVRKYGLSDEDINLLTRQILSKDGTFSESVIWDYYAGEDPIIQFKKNKIIEYGNWMLDKNYSDEAQLRNDLLIVKESIEKYGILNLHGFDSYQVKDLKFTITRYSSTGPVVESSFLFILLTYGLCCLGALLYLIPKKSNKGIQNNGIFHNSLTARGWLGIALGTFLIAFYVILFYYPEYMTNWVLMVDPISYAISGSEAGRFFLYGLLYTICVLVMGIRMTIKYRHSNYHLIRTASVMFFQLAFAFLIPEIMTGLSQPYFDFKNIWPLDYDFFFDSELNSLIQHGGLGIFMLVWGLALIIIAVPVFTYFLGKRWYCSWVCGCGGLAETLGDPFRQLSDKSLKAWKIERWMVHGVFVLAIGMTALVLYTYFTGEPRILFLDSYKVREAYGFWIGAGFAGVVGTGFYPLMGNRVWCRFGCPLAAYLGLIQRFKSRFRITTNGGQCISCGNCSTYCEMGIDVRSYAQKGENIIRSSCVGCGVCASVCPRGVLKLENANEAGRFKKSPLVG